MRAAVALVAVLVLSGCVATPGETTAEGSVLEVDFAWRPAAPEVHAPVAFEPTATRVPRGAVPSWSWDFGDGNGTQVGAPHHVFTRAGSYDVQLTLVLDSGERASRTHRVGVAPLVVEGGAAPDEHPDETPREVPVDQNGTPGDPEAPLRLTAESPVVVATFDTGANPFHPCHRRPGADVRAAGIPELPEVASLKLSFEANYDASIAASQEALAAVEAGALYHVDGTRLLFYGQSDEVVDYYPHGSQAASQIACREYGLAPDTWLLYLNWYLHRDHQVDYMVWVAAQPWIDVVHLNIQDLPLPFNGDVVDAIRAMVADGKLVVLAAGNGVAGMLVNYPMEASRYNGPPGSLVAGANENGGYEAYSNLNPHVVMDGCGTVAAEPYGFGDTTFSGTSSASPRITGYAARLLWEVRQTYPEAGRGDGALVRLPPDVTPPEGPLADGVLVAAELHEVTRKTADPNPHESRWDGDNCIVYWVPQPVDSPYSVYAKMGYGEVSEHTMPLALDVLLGRAEAPERPVADTFYAASEAVRKAYWG